MRVKEPYRCNYCPNVKGATNHWWLHPSPESADFRLLRWADGDPNEAGTEHICSEACASKALSRWMAEASGYNARTPEPDEKPSSPEKLAQPSRPDKFWEPEAALQKS